MIIGSGGVSAKSWFQVGVLLSTLLSFCVASRRTAAAKRVMAAWVNVAD